MLNVANICSVIAFIGLYIWNAKFQTVIRQLNPYAAGG